MEGVDPYGEALRHSFQACVFAHLLYTPRQGIADLSNEGQRRWSGERERERERERSGRVSEGPHNSTVTNTLTSSTSIISL